VQQLDLRAVILPQALEQLPAPEFSNFAVDQTRFRGKWALAGSYESFALETP